MIEKELNFNNNQTEYKTSKIIPCLFMVLISASFIIFAIGWFKLAASIPLVLVVAVSVFFSCKHMTGIWVPILNKKTVFRIAIIAIIVAVWVFLSGIGALVWQNADHNCRNPIFEDLVNKSWPVVDLSNDIVLVYYIGFWILPSIAGKIFGLQAGYIFQMVWAFILISFFLYFLFSIMKKISVKAVILFVFFSGMDIVLEILYFIYSGEIRTHIEWHSVFQFSSNTTQLFWVFNQALPAWVAVMFIISQKNCKNIVFVSSLILLSSPLPFIGLIPFIALLVFYYLPKKMGIKWSETKNAKANISAWCKEIFTFENFFGSMFVGLFTYIFFSANISGSITEGSDYQKKQILVMILFLLCEALILLFIIFLAKVRNPILYTSAIVLCLCPLFRIGYGYDFTMRASIPALIFVFLLTLKAIEQLKIDKNKVLSACLSAVLLLGAVTPVFEITRTVKNSIYNIQNGEPLKAQSADYLQGDNFRGSISESIYGKFFIKTNK